jgi:hypothetical protein
MKIKQTWDFYPSHRTGTLSNISIDEVNKALGFPPATFAKDDGDGKVTVQWQFEATVPSDIPMAGAREMPCSIWDYKGSLVIKQLSVWMPPEVGKNLFGEKYSNEGQY